MSITSSEKPDSGQTRLAVPSPQDVILDIDLEHNLPFTVNRLRGASVTILGRKGTGKSTTLRVLIEELLEQRRACVIVDPQDEYYTLGERYDIIVAGRTTHARVPLDPAKAGALAEFSLTHNVPVVLSLKKYADEERFELLKNFFTRLWELEEDARKLYFLFLEEAHVYLPQVGTTPVFGILSDIFLQGRKNGLATFLATQRSQKIHKDTISQSEVYFLHRVSHPKDVEVYEDLLPRPAKEVRALNSQLRKGSAIVMYEEDLPAEASDEVAMERVTRVQVRRSRTYHAGATPTFESSEPIVLRPLDGALLRELRTLLAEAEPGDSPKERELLCRIREMEEESVQKTELLAQAQASLNEQMQRMGILEEQIRLLGNIKVSFDGLTVPVLDLQKTLDMSVEQATIAANRLFLATPNENDGSDQARSDELKQARKLFYQRSQELHQTKDELANAQRQIAILKERLQSQSSPSAGAAGTASALEAQLIPLEQLLSLDERVRWSQLQKQFQITDPIERAIALTILAYERTSERQQELTIAHLALLTQQKNEQKIREHLPTNLIGLKIILQTQKGSNHARHYRGYLRSYLSGYFAASHVDRMCDEVLQLVEGKKR